MLIKQCTLLILALFSITNEVNSAQPPLPVGALPTLYEIWVRECQEKSNDTGFNSISCGPKEKNPLTAINERMTNAIRQFTPKEIEYSFSAPALIEASDCTTLLPLATKLINLHCVTVLLKEKNANPNPAVFTSYGKVTEFLNNHNARNQTQPVRFKSNQWNLNYTHGKENRQALASCFQPTTIMNEYIRAGEQLTGYNQEWVEIGKLLIEHGARFTKENKENIENLLLTKMGNSTNHPQIDGLLQLLKSNVWDPCAFLNNYSCNFWDQK